MTAQFVCLPRSRKALQATLDRFHVETASEYQRRDVTGDGQPETFCNAYVADVTAELGCPVPRMLANAQVAWLDTPDAKSSGWEPASQIEALAALERGEIVVVGWANPGGHGHIAIGAPSPKVGLHISQAGRTNFACRPVSSGFGTHEVSIWRHP